jgi:hypothetical protein
MPHAAPPAPPNTPESCRTEQGSNTGAVTAAGPEQTGSALQRSRGSGSRQPRPGRQPAGSPHARPAAAQTELDTMQRGNALVTRATPAELTVAGSLMAMDPQSEAVANALIGLRGTGHCGDDDALAGSGLTVY